MGNRIIINQGAIFSRLVVIECAGLRKGHVMYRCHCECGKETITRGSALKTGLTKSCGCLIMESIKNAQLGNIKYNVRINGKIIPEYDAWRKMKERCYNPNNARYPNYGGRGIRVCKRWLKSFGNFLSDMGKKPFANYSLDRIRVNGNYTPLNCRWASVKTQATNKTNTIYLLVNGAKINQSELARDLGVCDKSIENHRKKGKNGTDIYNYFKNKIHAN